MSCMAPYLYCQLYATAFYKSMVKNVFKQMKPTGLSEDHTSWKLVLQNDKDPDKSN